MIAIIFEVTPSDRGRQRYLDLATELSPSLRKMDGFLSIERFQSLEDSSKILSLSFWRDEQSVMAWRKLESHRQAQAEGRNSLFDEYRLRVVKVLRDYGLRDRIETPSDSLSEHPTHIAASISDGARLPK